MKSGLYQLVIRVKGIRVCALHCVREVTLGLFTWGFKWAH